MGTETTLESSYSQPCKPSDPAQEPSSALAGRSHPCASLQRQALRRLAHRRPPSLTLPRSRARSFQQWPSLALSAAFSSTTSEDRLAGSHRKGHGQDWYAKSAEWWTWKDGGREQATAHGREVFQRAPRRAGREQAAYHPSSPQLSRSNAAVRAEADAYTHRTALCSISRTRVKIKTCPHAFMSQLRAAPRQACHPSWSDICLGRLLLLEVLTSIGSLRCVNRLALSIDAKCRCRRLWNTP